MQKLLDPKSLQREKVNILIGFIGFICIVSMQSIDSILGCYF